MPRKIFLVIFPIHLMRIVLHIKKKILSVMHVVEFIYRCNQAASLIKYRYYFVDVIVVLLNVK